LLGCLVKCPACAHNFDAPEGEPVSIPEPRRESSPPRREYDDRPPSRRSRYDEDEDDYPRPRRRRYEEDEDYPRSDRYEDDDDYDDNRFRRSARKPGKVQAIAIMMLVGGILACMQGVGFAIYALALGVATCGVGLICLPFGAYSIVVGIFAIIKGSKLLGERAYRESPPQGVAIMQIVNIINLDVVNLTLGIINLVFLSEREVKNYFRRR
jgi:hypothetical protein